MPNLDIQIQRRRSDEPDYVAVVRVSDGREFHLGIVKSVLDAWRDQVGELDVDAVASKLAWKILEQQPSTGRLNEGFLITLDDDLRGCVANERRKLSELPGEAEVASNVVQRMPSPKSSEVLDG